MDKIKAGVVCAANNCKSKSYMCKKKSFFRFPKDPLRARTWAIVSNREDLISKVENLYKSYRLCSDHFESHMFTNKFHNRLKISAVPTIFFLLEEFSSNNLVVKLDHNYSAGVLDVAVDEKVST